MTHRRILSERWSITRSPSRDKGALDALGADLADRLRRLGASVEYFANPHGGDHLLARFPGPAGRRPALVLGHFDTVWPRGTIERLPFRVESGRVFGPGTYDMKAGLVPFRMGSWPSSVQIVRSDRYPRPILGRVHLRRGDRQPGRHAA